MFRKKFIMNLQLFAADTGAGNGAAGNGGASGTDTGVNNTNNGEGNGSNDSDKGVSFDDFLKNSKNQSEFDKRVAKALETAKSKWETEKATELENAKTEAEKLAKMNAEQKAKYAEEKRIAELDKREKDITTRELKATAYETLASKNLPKELVEILNYTDAESCNKSIEAVEKAFQTAVEKAVNDKLRGGKPPKAGAPKGNDLQTIISNAMRNK